MKTENGSMECNHTPGAQPIDTTRRMTPSARKLRGMLKLLRAEEKQERTLEREEDRTRLAEQRRQVQAEREQVSERWRRQREAREFPYLNFDEVAPMVRGGAFATMVEFAAHYKLSLGMARWLQRIVQRRSGMKDAEWRACFAETRKKRRKAASSAPERAEAKP